MRNSVASRVLGAHLILNVVSFSSSSLKSTLKIQQDSKTLPSADTNVIMVAPFSCRERHDVVFFSFCPFDSFKRHTCFFECNSGFIDIEDTSRGETDCLISLGQLIDE